MKERLRKIIIDAAKQAHVAGILHTDVFAGAVVEAPNVEAHGDFATNFAMANASVLKKPPRKIAGIILEHIDDPDGIIEKFEIAGPGFINFFIRPSAWHPILCDIHEKKETYGASDIGRNKKVQVEFVSANPTGPLHVGHGRGAVVGDSLASILAFCQYAVTREYYINDNGRQIDTLTLGRSVHARCRELSGRDVTFPEDGYKGDYVYDIARDLLEKDGENLFAPEETGSADAVINRCAEFAAAGILAGIRTDLECLGIRFDVWFSEKGLYESGKVRDIMEALKLDGRVYEKDGALWFKSSDYGDEKDRVVVRSNGQTTYFASDIAYHRDKFDRGFDRVVDVWGADHHGYVPRLSAAIDAMGYDRECFKVILVHLVNLLRDNVQIAMSTRAGEFTTLKDVVDEVGSDAARFIFLTRHHESPLDFDLDLAKKKTNDNPVYYVQYVHARISSILKKAEADGCAAPKAGIAPDLSGLNTVEDVRLMKHLSRYPGIIETAALMMEPHRVAYFLMELAAAFHAYYNKHRVLTDDPDMTVARLYLVSAVAVVIKNGLNLLGVFAPESM
ncbi:MAG: arginine--tRNA ligase [Deltaproteobacteria bacterium]|nr:arginine--tRNA ligase [Deltaproteobacteria bacterium]